MAILNVYNLCSVCLTMIYCVSKAFRSITEASCVCLSLNLKPSQCWVSHKHFHASVQPRTLTHILSEPREETRRTQMFCKVGVFLYKRLVSCVWTIFFFFFFTIYLRPSCSSALTCQTDSLHSMCSASAANNGWEVRVMTAGQLVSRLKKKKKKLQNAAWINRFVLDNEVFFKKIKPETQAVIIVLSSY